MKMMSCVVTALILALCSWTVLAQSVDINTATAEELQALQGIGPKKAAIIVQYRDQHGPFKSVDDLAQVPGIGDKTLQSLRSQLTVGAAAEATGTAAPMKPMEGAAESADPKAAMPKQ